MTAPRIRKPVLFALVTLASAAAAVGACLSLAGLGVAPTPPVARAEPAPSQTVTANPPGS